MHELCDISILKSHLVFEPFELVGDLITERVIEVIRDEVGRAHASQGALQWVGVVRRHRAEVILKLNPPLFGGFEAVGLEELVQQRQQNGVVVRHDEQVHRL